MSFSARLPSLLRRLARPKDPPTYHSRFGGLWTDAVDFAQRLRRQRLRGLHRGDAKHLAEWSERGFVILPGAVAPSSCDAILADIDRAWQGQLGPVRAEIMGPNQVIEIDPSRRSERHKILDLHYVSEATRAAVFAEPVTRFLRLVFEADVLAFQSLAFEWGSNQGLHQDSAYVVVDREPLHLAAAWLALEDISPGSGELEIFVGSHRMDEFVFGGDRKFFHPDWDGAEVHDRYQAHLAHQIEARGYHRETFLARKGDVLIWSADVVHGGSHVRVPEATRRSLVTHYCPATLNPLYLTDLEDPETHKHRWCPGRYFASFQYDVSRRG